MLESILMTASLFVLGYGFYMSARMFWVYRTQGSVYRPIYFVVMVLIVSIYFIFSMILFSFIVSNAIFSQAFQVFNTILAVFWLSGAGLVTAILKYHINVVGSVSDRRIRLSFKGIKKVKDPSRKNLFTAIKNMKDDLGRDKNANRFAVGRELKLIDLNNKIDDYERSFKSRIRK
ncbi:MAG: hypothetical protein ACXABY_30500 [Candidatus Thorarchaeota archaeon]|jgi:hypothetical protein